MAENIKKHNQNIYDKQTHYPSTSGKARINLSFMAEKQRRKQTIQPKEGNIHFRLHTKTNWQIPN